MSQEAIEAPARRPLINIPPALRYAAYRSYWFGTLASVSGFQMFQFGQYWLVYQLTGSPLFLGTIGLANAIPAIVLNLFGGVFADLFDKRRLIIVTQSITAILIFLLAADRVGNGCHMACDRTRLHCRGR
ncbi:MAG: MFS transporter [Chloroflexi bacterium]|nr:MFS transporter [Chloroflexota bacterium]